MKSCLLKYKPKDTTNEEFEKTWENIGYSLQALHKLLDELIQNNNEISRADFDCPNHYAKLAFQSGENRAYAFIKTLLPQTSKSNF
jgi:hypothetical protein